MKPGVRAAWTCCKRGTVHNNLPLRVCRNKGCTWPRYPQAKPVPSVVDNMREPAEAWGPPRPKLL
eukprot:12818002-Alexandrium_andersonii.AAC.1